MEIKLVRQESRSNEGEKGSPSVLEELKPFCEFWRDVEGLRSEQDPENTTCKTDGKVSDVDRSSDEGAAGTYTW